MSERFVPTQILFDLNGYKCEIRRNKLTRKVFGYVHLKSWHPWYNQGEKTINDYIQNDQMFNYKIEIAIYSRQSWIVGFCESMENDLNDFGFTLMCLIDFINMAIKREREEDVAN